MSTSRVIWTAVSLLVALSCSHPPWPPYEGTGRRVLERLETRSLMTQSSAYLASTPEVTLDTKWGGARGFFSGVGLFLLKASGPGTVFVASYGAVLSKQCEGEYIIDTDHIVAFQDTLKYGITKVGGIKSLFLGGEGLVAKFSGQGMIYAQTRSPSALAGFLHPYRPTKSNN